MIEHNLIDEYRLITVPVVLGREKRLFAEGTKPVALKAIDRRSTDAGVSIDVCVPASEPIFGGDRTRDRGARPVHAQAAPVQAVPAKVMTTGMTVSAG